MRDMSRGFQPVYTPAPRAGLPGWLLALIGIGVVSLVVVIAIILFSGGQTPTPSPSPTSAAATSLPASQPPSSAAPTVGPSASADQSAPPGQTTSPSVEPSGPGQTIDPELAAQIDAVTQQIPPIRQLQPTTDVPYEFISREQFREDLIELNDEDVPLDVRLAEERLLKRIGLLDEDADLEALILELYGAQVAAFYRPDNGRFYIIERDAPFGPVDRIITAHEYTHALQDQHFDLEGTRIADPAEGDRALAQLAAIEGDATLTSQLWMGDNLTTQEILEIVSESLSGLDEDALAGMPLVLRRQLEFPYSDGFLFVFSIHRLGGFEAVDETLRTPPASTEQILHPEKYLAGEAPVAVTLDDVSAALGDGWSRTLEQTMGELGIQILATGGEEPPIAIPGLPVEWPHAEVAAGWGGDRMNMYEHSDGRWAIAWLSKWDTADDAAEFSTRVGELTATFGGASRVIYPWTGDFDLNEYIGVFIGSDQSVVEAVAGAI